MLEIFNRLLTNTKQRDLNLSSLLNSSTAYFYSTHLIVHSPTPKYCKSAEANKIMN